MGSLLDDLREFTAPIRKELDWRSGRPPYYSIRDCADELTYDVKRGSLRVTRNYQRLVWTGLVSITYNLYEDVYLVPRITSNIMYSEQPRWRA
jgi:hypothetical protein